MATSKIVTLEEFKYLSIQWFTQGKWRVQYHDSSHLPDKAYIDIGKIFIEEITPSNHMMYRFYPPSTSSRAQSDAEHQMGNNGDLVAQYKAAWSSLSNGTSGEANKNAERATKYVLDQLGESLVRLGLLCPTLEVDDHDFQRRRFAVVVMDTNSLRDGSIRHLREQYGLISLWVTIPQVSLMEIGERVANLTAQSRDGLAHKNVAFIRHRPQVTIIPEEILWIQANLPHEKLELAPELLRTFRGFDRRKGDDTEPDVFSINDRLILEGIKDLRRQRGLIEEVFLMTSDKDMARLARLEGIHTIFPATPDIGQFSDGIYSLRYSCGARTFIACSLQRLLWDFTHVFSRVRIECVEGSQIGRQVELFYYYPSKLVNDWTGGKLEVIDLGPSAAANTP